MRKQKERCQPRAVPPPRLDVLQLGLPDQGAIGEEPRVRPAGMRGDEASHESVVILVGVVGPGRIRAGILQDAMDLRHMPGRERHPTAGIRTPPAGHAGSSPPTMSARAGTGYGHPSNACMHGQFVRLDCNANTGRSR